MASVRASRGTSSDPEGLVVRFWGVRGSVAVPGPSTVWYGGNTACVEVRCGSEIVILDAGTGIRELGKELAQAYSARASRVWILITHTHWDHIQGFPFFAPAYQSGHRIRIVGWRGSRAGLKRTVAAAVESPFFPVALREMPGSITVEELAGSTFRVGKMRGRAARLNHPGGGVGFRLDTAHGSLAYVPDHEIPCSVAGTSGSGRERKVVGRTLPRDRARLREMELLVREVDLLIHDAQYTADEYSRRIGWGHSCVDAVVEQAMRCGARRLVLFHHDPDRDDGQLDTILAQARAQAARAGSPLVIDAAREGMQLRLQDGRWLDAS